jgi:putative oxidoreductase
MNWLQLIGRIMYGGFFVYNGVSHFLGMDQMTPYAASKGVPMPQLAVIASGLLILVGGAMVLAGWKTRWGALMIVLFLIPVSLMMHDFWAVDDAMGRMNELAHFGKNLTLAGAALMIAWVERWPLSIDSRSPSA